MAEKSGGLFSFFKSKTNRASVDETEIVQQTPISESVSESVSEPSAESSDAVSVLRRQECIPVFGLFIKPPVQL